jgi:hypothetical protein
MKLKTIIESSNDLYDYFSKVLPKSPPVNKLLKWALSKHNHTNPGDKHTSELLIKELNTGARLVGNPWKENAKGDLNGLYVIDYGSQLMVSLPENSDIVDLVINTDSPENHLVRGLAFGYDPIIVKKYYAGRATDHMWKNILKSNGVKLSSDYPSGGYASVVRGNSGTANVEPGDIDTIKPIIDKFPLIQILRFCPECNMSVMIKGDKNKYHDGILQSCPHKPIHEPEKPANKRASYDFEFDISSII